MGLEQLAHKQNEHLLGFKQDLTHATEGLYNKLSADKEAQAAAHKALTGQLDTAKATVAAELEGAKELFESRVITLTNAIGANKKYFLDHMHDMTGVVTDWKKASDADRADIRKVRNAMVSDLHIGIERAIAIGEAKAKAEAAADDIEDYLKKGKTKGLNSVGDLLSTLAATAGEAPPAATEGEGFGAESIPSV